jgi:hypothetical protein
MAQWFQIAKNAKPCWFSVHFLMEVAPRIELGIKVLQTCALPLGYATAKNGAEDEI